MQTLSGSEKCVSWDFSLQDWTRKGCRTSVSQSGTVTCTCNHLTNFAVLVVSHVSVASKMKVNIEVTTVGCLFEAERLPACQPNN